MGIRLRLRRSRQYGTVRPQALIGFCMRFVKPRNRVVGSCALLRVIRFIHEDYRYRKLSPTVQLVI